MGLVSVLVIGYSLAVVPLWAVPDHGSRIRETLWEGRVPPHFSSLHTAPSQLFVVPPPPERMTFSFLGLAPDLLWRNFV